MGKSEAKAMWVSHKCEYTIYICIFLHLYPLPTINCTKLYAQEYILKCISAIIHQLNIITLTHKSTLFIPIPTRFIPIYTQDILTLLECGVFDFKFTQTP